MPYFDYEGDMRIDPDEYLDSCDKNDIQELIDYLIEKKYIPSFILNEKHTGTQTCSVPELEFNHTINKIVSCRLQLTVEEEELLKKIANRF